MDDLTAKERGRVLLNQSTVLLGASESAYNKDELMPICGAPTALTHGEVARLVAREMEKLGSAIMAQIHKSE